MPDFVLRPSVGVAQDLSKSLVLTPGLSGQF
jgi:hypothetical protein